MGRLTRAYQGVLRSLIRSDSWNSCGPVARDLYVRLLLDVDGGGRAQAGAKTVLGSLYGVAIVHGTAPSLEEIKAAMRELATAGMLHAYEVDGTAYLELTPFVDPGSRPRNAQHPGPEDGSPLDPPTRTGTGTGSGGVAPTGTSGATQKKKSLGRAAKAEKRRTAWTEAESAIYEKWPDLKADERWTVPWNDWKSHRDTKGNPPLPRNSVRLVALILKTLDNLSEWRTIVDSAIERDWTGLCNPSYTELYWKRASKGSGSKNGHTPDPGVAPKGAANQAAYRDWTGY